MLLKNDGVLPLAADTIARIAVIGGHAHIGVPLGTGSSAVLPPGGFAAIIKIGGPGIAGQVRNLYLHPSSPFEELKKLLPNAQIEWDPGMSPAETVLLTRRSDIAIVFGIRVEGESFDLADLSLGMNPRMAAIMGSFQVLWVEYGLMIGSNSVIKWNVIAICVNALTVGAYFYFARAEKRAGAP